MLRETSCLLRVRDIRTPGIRTSVLGAQVWAATQPRGQRPRPPPGAWMDGRVTWLQAPGPSPRPPEPTAPAPGAPSSAPRVSCPFRPATTTGVQNLRRQVSRRPAGSAEAREPRGLAGPPAPGVAVPARVPAGGAAALAEGRGVRAPGPLALSTPQPRRPPESPRAERGPGRGDPRPPRPSPASRGRGHRGGRMDPPPRPPVRLPQGRRRTCALPAATHRAWGTRLSSRGALGSGCPPLIPGPWMSPGFNHPGRFEG